ncbi:hypothetical protein AB1Y20_001068 [Prymnesium parvum]|uniref:Uncharacterized protein n=1 Tax=Prymnesium parvum TaxID=97485 RepID=A0AB34K9T6_PRYPA
MHHYHRPLPVEVALPVSWALSRPFSTASLVVTDPYVALLFATLVSLIVLVFERALHSLLQSSDATGELSLSLLGILLQLLRSTNTWLAAEIAVRIAATHPATADASFSLHTFFGACGIILTTLAFSVPPVWSAITDAWSIFIALLMRIHFAPQLLLHRVSLASRAIVGVVWARRNANLRASEDSPATEAIAEHSSSALPFESEMQLDTLSALPGAQGRSMRPSVDLLKGTGRRRAGGGARGIGTRLEYEGSERSSSKSLASMTEQMTQMALSAKNDELERLTTRQQKLLTGVANVIQELRRISDKHASQGVEGADEGGQNRVLLEGCMRAQEKLSQLLRLYDDYGLYGPPLPASDTRPGKLPSSYALEDDANANVRLMHHDEHPTASLVSRSCRSGERTTLPKVDSGVEPLTWTSAMGVSDVHSRLYD